MIDRVCEDKLYRTLNSYVMLRLRKLTHMCSRTVSDPANRFRKTRKKKSSAVPLFRSGHMSAICARLGSKGKVGVQRGRETVGVPSFLPTAVGTAPSPPRARRIPALRRAQLPAEVQQKTPRPSGSNPPAAVRVPRSAGAEKSCPSGSNPPAAVRVPRSACAEKRKAPQNCFHGAQSMHFYSNRSSVSTSLRAGACGSCAG